MNAATLRISVVGGCFLVVVSCLFAAMLILQGFCHERSKTPTNNTNLTTSTEESHDMTNEFTTFIDGGFHFRRDSSSHVHRLHNYEVADCGLVIWTEGSLFAPGQPVEMRLLMPCSNEKPHEVATPKIKISWQKGDVQLFSVEGQFDDRPKRAKCDGRNYWEFRIPNCLANNEGRATRLAVGRYCVDLEVIVWNRRVSIDGIIVDIDEWKRMFDHERPAERNHVDG